MYAYVRFLSESHIRKILAQFAVNLRMAFGTMSIYYIALWWRRTQVYDAMWVNRWVESSISKRNIEEHFVLLNFVKLKRTKYSNSSSVLIRWNYLVPESMLLLPEYPKNASKMHKLLPSVPVYMSCVDCRLIHMWKSKRKTTNFDITYTYTALILNDTH